MSENYCELICEAAERELVLSLHLQFGRLSLFARSWEDISGDDMSLSIAFCINMILAIRSGGILVPWKASTTSTILTTSVGFSFL